jgi:hypothetical protein
VSFRSLRTGTERYTPGGATVSRWGDIDSDQFADLSQRRFQSLFEGRMIHRKSKHSRCRLAALDSPCEQVRDVIHSRTEKHGSRKRVMTAGPSTVGGGVRIPKVAAWRTL